MPLTVPHDIEGDDIEGDDIEGDRTLPHPQARSSDGLPMRRRTAVTNGVLALVLVGTAAGGWLAIGNPSPATAATDRKSVV